MTRRAALGPLVLAGLFLASTPLPVRAQPVDPAVVGERLQRLTAAVESLELALASQKRHLENLGSEVQKLREETLDRRGDRPWAEDLRRLADAIAEVDRKRVSDSEQVVKVLTELRKTIATAAEPPKPSRSTGPEHSTEGRGGAGSKKGEPTPEKAVPYQVQGGDTLSKIVTSFNAQARQEGYQPVTVDQVMKFNNLTDPRRVREGMTLQLPLVPK